MMLAPLTFKKLEWIQDYSEIEDIENQIDTIDEKLIRLDKGRGSTTALVNENQ